MLLTMIACIENGVQGKDSIVGFDSAADCPGCPDPDDTSEGETDSTPPPPDHCALATAEAGSVPMDETCAAGTTTTADAFKMRVQYHESTGAYGSITTPLVVNLDDDNGDGIIGDGDIPEIVVATTSASGLVALSGDGSGELFSVPDWYYEGELLGADVDADGVIDICGYDVLSHHPQCVDSTGTLLWTSKTQAIFEVATLNACDLDQDGLPEVIAELNVLNGQTGSKLFALPMQNELTEAVCADLDGDGRTEILYGPQVFTSEGGPLFRMAENFGFTAWPMVVDLDGDADAEVVYAADAFYRYDSDGTLLSTTPFGTADPYPGPPCAADFDGDGDPEFAVPVDGYVQMYETDGSQVWSVLSDDTSGYAGCVAFDLDGDGASEVLFADEEALHVYDGRTGTELVRGEDHSSGTLAETPVVADVDNDGSAEIVTVESWQPPLGVTVWEHDGSGWPSTGPAWPNHAFSLTNIEQDGHVPAAPEASWLNENSFRARAITDERPSPDLGGAIVDVCADDCELGPIRVSVQVWNRGALSASAGAPYTIYKDDDGVLTYVSSGTLPAVAVGESIASFEIELSPDQVGSSGFSIVLDDDAGTQTLVECDEDNNALRTSDVPCP